METLNGFKDDKEIQILIQNTPQTTIELQAQLDSDIRKEVQLNANSLRNKTPIQLLKSLMTLINEFGVDPSKGDDNLKTMIVEAFSKNVSADLSTYEDCLQFATYISDF